MSFFRWITASVRNAVIDGVREAFVELDQRPEVPAVTFTVSAALPAPNEAPKKRK